MTKGDIHVRAVLEENVCTMKQVQRVRMSSETQLKYQNGLVEVEKYPSGGDFGKNRTLVSDEIDVVIESGGRSTARTVWESCHGVHILSIQVHTCIGVWFVRNFICMGYQYVIPAINTPTMHQDHHDSSVQEVAQK